MRLGKFKEEAECFVQGVGTLFVRFTPDDFTYIQGGPINMARPYSLAMNCKDAKDIFRLTVNDIERSIQLMRISFPSFFFFFFLEFSRSSMFFFHTTIHFFFFFFYHIM